MVKNKSVLVVLLFSLFLSFGLLCSAADYDWKRSERDPQQRYEECQKRCEWDTRSEKEQDRCEAKCERKFREEQEEEGGRRRHDLNTQDPRKRYEECQSECSQQEQSEQPQCQQRCLRRFEQEQQQQRQPQRQVHECERRCEKQHQQRPEKVQECVSECRERFEEEPKRSSRREEEEEKQSHNNPFYFPRRQSSQARYEEEHGNFWVLQRFSEKSQLLKGINQFRIAMIEANPNTFVLPHHCDAEKIYVVTNGKGTLTFVIHENKESFNLERGVVVRVPAGSTVYLVNQDNNERLNIAFLHRPVNNPGKFEEFFAAGPQSPDQSYLRTFSHEILETVLNTPREQLDRLFEGKQSQQGVFRRASQEQIRALSQEATSPKEKGGERFAFNLLTQSPKYSNQNGRFYEACPREFEQLRDVEASIVGFEINQGSIFVPHYNTKATFAVLVTEGNMYVEMVSPHQSSQSSQRHQEEREEETRSGEYKKVTAQMSAGDIFVVPAGHPVTYVASQNKKVRALAFGLFNENNPINQHNDNRRIFIAGKNNNVRQWDREAKDLSFGVESRLVDEVFNNNPQESYFVSGSQQRQRGSEESRGTNPLSSILDFARLF